MIRKDPNLSLIHSASRPSGSEADPHLPKRPYVQAVARLKLTVTDLEVEYDDFGFVRTMSTSSDAGMFRQPAAPAIAPTFAGNAVAHAKAFLANSTIARALALNTVTIDDGDVDDIGFGYRVYFRQQLQLKGKGDKYIVRGGFVHVFMRRDGTVFQVSSTLRHGKRPSGLGRILSRDAAIEKAKARMLADVADEVKSKSSKPKALGKVLTSYGIVNTGSLRKLGPTDIDSLVSQAQHKFDDCQSPKAELVFSSHDEHMDAIYEITLWNSNPRKAVLYLVKARTGEVVHVDNKLHFYDLNAKRGPKATAGGVAGKGFKRIPDPKLSINSQVKDLIVADLPDPKLLKNSRFDMKVKKGGSWVTVAQKADGTYNFDPKDAEFDAVAVFFALNEQMKLYEAWGLKKQDKPIPVFVRDPEVSDNAYFDPVAYEIHLGLGSGLKNGGLNENIAWDLGVEWHENGHHIVALQTPGGDLPGEQGGAMHESTGDTLGDLLMDFWFRLVFGADLGHTLTKADVSSDPLIVGLYALPPNGIRIQKNKKKYPGDMQHEVHDDGLISGGATADLLVGMATDPAADLKTAFENYGKLYLAALALVPAHKVLFKDMLRAMINADANLNKGATKKLIEKSFSDHGITLTSANTKKSPKKRSPKRK